ncbi:MAG: DNA polymerase III subunit delta' [Verrucomicrobia bacterium]|nr:DNA polymerase III subunit delta' [Verrucomicrobiota bacterium]
MSFDDFSGDRAVAERLQRSLRENRLAHAYLFAGPRGSGKRAVAATLAQALNCLQRKHDACGRCKSCLDIEKGSHPDVHWVKPESKSRQIKIDQIREFTNAIALKPMDARVKVGVITDAECMNEAAQNAFLKTLEEPPSRTVILLLTGEPQRLLPTILSRCLRLSFGAILTERTPEQERTLSLLVEFAAAQPRGIAHVYRLHAALTKLLGEIRASVEETVPPLDEDVEAEGREKLEKERAAQIEGEYRGRRERVLEELYTWFADALLCVSGAEAAVLAHGDHLDELRRATAGLSWERAAAQLDAVEGIRDALARHISEPFALEVGLLKLI